MPSPDVPRVADLMRPFPFTLPPTLAAVEVAHEINRVGVRHVFVVDDDGRVTGLVNRARLLRHLVAQRIEAYHLPDLPVGDLLVAKPVSISPDASAADAIQLMRRNRIGSLPVVDADGRLVGLLSERLLLAYAEAVICGEMAYAS